MEIITRVNSIYEKEIQIETEILKHTIVEEEMTKNASFFGPEVLKHLVQNSSLLGNLQSKEILKVIQELSLFRSNHFFSIKVNFGDLFTTHLIDLMN